MENKYTLSVSVFLAHTTTGPSKHIALHRILYSSVDWSYLNIKVESLLASNQILHGTFSEVVATPSEEIGAIGGVATF